MLISWVIHDGKFEVPTFQIHPCCKDFKPANHDLKICGPVPMCKIPRPSDFLMDYAAVLALDPPENSMRARWQEGKLRVAIVGSHSSQLTQTGEMLQELITPLELH